MFEYMPENLHTTIRGEGVDRVDLKIYTWQMFAGLKYLAAVRITVSNYRNRVVRITVLDYDSTVGKITVFYCGSTIVLQ